jgi:ADP-heptose:LPS heptosyltransferase
MMLSSLLSKSRAFFSKDFLPHELANPRRILMTHFDSTDDIVRSIPILVALRHRFPHAEIAWLIEENAAPLLLDHWAVNRLIVVRKNWSRHMSEVRRVRQRLQSFAPQVAIDPQNSFSSSLAAWLAHATYRIGFGGSMRRSLHNIRVIAESKHRIERNLQLLEPFGIFGSGVGFDMPECERDRITAQNILHWKGLHGNFALLNISANSPSACWQEERYGAVAQYLLEEWNLPSLIVWSGYEMELRRAETAVHTANGAAQQAPETTLAVRGSLARLATLFVGSDSADLQIAAAVGTKCVGLFGSTSALENAPFAQLHRMVQAQPEQGRKKQQRLSLLGWMDAIQPEAVCEKCDEVLADLLNPNVLAIPQEHTASQQKKAA